MLAVLGGSATPRGGEGKASVFMRCRSCVCSPRWVRLSGTGLLGKSDPRASDASAQLQLGAPRAVPAAVPSGARSGPPQAPVPGQRAGREPGWPVPPARSASSGSGRYEHQHSPGH